MLQPFMAAWYVYTAVLSFLVAMSAGRRSALGVLGLAGAVVSLILGVSLYRLIPGGDTVAFSGNVFLAFVALVAVVRGPREDTRLIALFLLLAAALPLFLHFYRPPG